MHSPHRYTLVDVMHLVMQNIRVYIIGTSHDIDSELKKTFVVVNSKPFPDKCSDLFENLPKPKPSALPRQPKPQHWSRCKTTMSLFLPQGPKQALLSPDTMPLPKLSQKKTSTLPLRSVQRHTHISSIPSPHSDPVNSALNFIPKHVLHLGGYHQQGTKAINWKHYFQITWRESLTHVSSQS